MPSSLQRRRKQSRKKAGKKLAPSGKFPGGRVRQKIAKFVGISDRTLEKAQKVVEATERDPATYGETPHT